MNNLVVVCAGDNSVHESWLAAKEFKNFDLFIIYYGNIPDKYYTDADFYVQNKGYKFPLLYKHLYKHYALDQYDYFWFPDDDIKATTADINLLFQQMNESLYWIAQPSIKKDCPHTWPHTTTKKGNIYRETQLVEIMCPIFRKTALDIFLPKFKETNTGWGLDRLWSETTLKKSKNLLGIFDIISVEHMRKMGNGDLYSNLKKDGINYKKEYQDFLQKYQLKHIKQSEKINWW
jgi:hypothetical protein